MRHRLLTLLAASSVSSADIPPKPVVLLSDQVLAAWEFIAATPMEIGKVCVACDGGILSIAGKPTGYLVTKEPHENYHLHFEWRWPVGAKNSNSGVLIHIAPGPTAATPWPVCFQAQLKMDHAGDLLPMPTARFSETLSTQPDAKTPQLDRSGPSNEKPPGEWNAGDITCGGGEVDVMINGVRQNHVSGCVPAVGKIGFQLEGAPFELRNVSISLATVPSATPAR
ncbi:MAG: DUF1080 domain-containing protein [Luteolibacter sp.]